MSISFYTIRTTIYAHLISLDFTTAIIFRKLRAAPHHVIYSDSHYFIP